MTPKTVVSVKYKTLHDFTYGIASDGSHLVGMLDGVEAVAQSVRLRLNTEKGAYPIYGPSYGVAFRELIGAPLGFALPEIERRTREALLVDERIVSVTLKSASVDAGNVSENFLIKTVYGDFESVVTV